MEVWHQNRAEVAFFNPHYYGIICCFCIMIGFYLISTTRLRWLRIFSLIAIFANLFGLNFTQNRTAFPAIIFGAIIYLFTTIKELAYLLAQYRCLWCWSSLSLLERFGSSNGTLIHLWKNECRSGMQV